MPYFFPIYNATAIANAKPADAAPTGVPDASKKTDLLAGKVQNTSFVPALKSTTLSELELLKIVAPDPLVKFALVPSNVPSPTSNSLVP